MKLSSIHPAGYLRANSTLHVTGRMINQSESGYQRVSVRLRFRSQPMANRGELETYADGKGLDPQQAGPQRLAATSLPVGGQQPWSVSLKVRQMGLSTFGVYPISVEVLSAAGTVLGHVRTFVTYYPAGSIPQKTKVAWVWPIIDQPHRADDSTFVDDGLERQLGSGGRLSNLVAAAARTTTQVSWLLDPSLVEDATRMGDTDGYSIKGTSRPQSVAANDWLRSLHAAVTAPGDRLIATPYADPDVMALAQHGMSDDVKFAAQQGTHTLATVSLSGATPGGDAPGRPRRPGHALLARRQWLPHHPAEQLGAAGLARRDIHRGPGRAQDGLGHERQARRLRRHPAQDPGHPHDRARRHGRRRAAVPGRDRHDHR